MKNFTQINSNQRKMMIEITVCPYCDAPTEERNVGDEGFTYCSDGCGCLEGEKLPTKYECEICHELSDFNTCDCLV